MAYADKEKQRAYQRRWRQGRRDAYFADKSCVKCGSTDRLELDHRDRKKKVSHSIWGWTKRKRLDEIAKCQILCQPCHREKTRLDMGYGLKHGTEHGYRNYRCRCEKCRGAHRMKMQRYRATLRLK